MVNASRLNAVLVSSHEAEQLPELLGLNHGQMSPSDPRELVMRAWAGTATPELAAPSLSFAEGGSQPGAQRCSFPCSKVSPG